MKDISALEKAVYERELKSLQAEIGKGVEIIRKALEPYCNDSISSYGMGSAKTISAEKGDADAFDTWVANLPIGKLTYFSGYHFIATTPQVSTAPEFLRKAVLAVAIRKFIAQVDSVDEVRNIAEQANHAANQ